MRQIVYYPANANSKMVAGARIARWLYKTLSGEKLLLDGKGIKELDTVDSLGEYILFMVNVPKTMISDVPRTEILIRKAKIVVWLQNDYSIWAPTTETEGQSIVTGAFTWRLNQGKPTLVWSTCGHRVDKHPTDYRYINWNALAFTPVAAANRAYKGSVLYYGAFREGRVKEFTRYMKHEDAHKLFRISAPPAAETKFKEAFGLPDSSMVGVLDIPTDLTTYTSTLYMEDDLSHRQFHSPANRFYESLSAGLALFVDISAAHTLEQAGYRVPNVCLVTDYASLAEKVKLHKKVIATQATWYDDPATGLGHQEALKQRLKVLLKELKKL